MVELCRTLNIEFIAEGVETISEFVALQDCGVNLIQGYFIARPAFEALPEFSLPGDGPRPMGASHEQTMR
jgi:EAL domain-containing protein (putative c-di-GMP-specific phosphodiesterase class I)